MTPHTKYDSTSVEIKYISKKKGRGVFAKRVFMKDAIVEKAPTIKIVVMDEEDFLADSSLAYYIFGSENATHIGLGYTSLYNHSSKDPNTEITITNNSIIIKATRHINKGEEITFDYGWSKEYTKGFSK